MIYTRSRRAAVVAGGDAAILGPAVADSALVLLGAGADLVIAAEHLALSLIATRFNFKKIH